MLPDTFCVELLAFILLSAISERGLLAGQCFGKDTGGTGGDQKNEAPTDCAEARERGTHRTQSGLGTSKGPHLETIIDNEAETGSSDESSKSVDRRKYMPAHEKHAESSDDQSHTFWADAARHPDTGDFDYSSVVRVEADGAHWCLGVLALLKNEGTSTNEHNVKLVTPWNCWAMSHRDDPAKIEIKTLDNQLLVVDLKKQPMKLVNYGEELAVKDVKSADGQPLKPARLAKRNMPLDAAGVAVQRDKSLVSLRVLNEKDSFKNIGPTAYDSVGKSFYAKNDKNDYVDWGAPFFVKSSGEWYLAGIKIGSIGGSFFEIINEETAIRSAMFSLLKGRMH